MVSLSNHPPSEGSSFDKLRMSGERGVLASERRAGYKPAHTRMEMATQVTVVPAKAGIQEILSERACRLPKVLDSGFRRNDGFMTGMAGLWSE